MDAMALEGIRIVEFTHAVAGPFAGGMLGDFGAEVIKVEQPGVGDSLRRMDPADAPGLWFTVNGRNKQSVEADLKNPEQLEWVHRLVDSADVVIANYRPGVLERFGLGWEDIHARSPRTILLSISGFGPGGPYSDRPGFGKIGEAFSGSTNLTGFADRPPIHPGFALGDYSTGLFGAFGILVALRERDRSGVGQRIDLGLYDGLLRMIEWQVPYFEKLGLDLTRNGSLFPFEGGFVTEICTAADGQNVVVSAATEASIERLAAYLTASGHYTKAGIDKEAVTQSLREWVAEKSAPVAIDELQEAGLAAGPVMRPQDLVNDPHVRAREDLIEVPTDDWGTVTMPAPVPRLSRTPGTVRWAGRNLGADNGKVQI